MTMVFLGIDLAKNVFALHGVDATGRACLVRPSVRRDQLLEMVAKLPPCTVGMEAFLGSARQRLKRLTNSGVSYFRNLLTPGTRRREEMAICHRVIPTLMQQDQICGGMLAKARFGTACKATQITFTSTTPPHSMEEIYTSSHKACEKSHPEVTLVTSGMCSDCAFFRLWARRWPCVLAFARMTVV